MNPLIPDGVEIDLACWARIDVGGHGPCVQAAEGGARSMSLLRWGYRFLGLLLGWCLHARIRSAMALMTAATATRTRTTRSMSVGTMSTLSARLTLKNRAEVYQLLPPF